MCGLSCLPRRGDVTADPWHCWSCNKAHSHAIDHCFEGPSTANHAAEPSDWEKHLHGRAYFGTSSVKPRRNGVLRYLNRLMSLEQIEQAERGLVVDLVICGFSWVANPTHALFAITRYECPLDRPFQSSGRPGTDGAPDAGFSHSEFHGNPSIA